LLEIGAEAIIHIGANAELFRLDRLGQAIWRQLDGDVPLGDLIDALAVTGDREAVSASVLTFIHELDAHDLLLDHPTT
jgi:hypothetical protein